MTINVLVLSDSLPLSLVADLVALYSAFENVTPSVLPSLGENANGSKEETRRGCGARSPEVMVDPASPSAPEVGGGAIAARPIARGGGRGERSAEVGRSFELLLLLHDSELVELDRTEFLGFSQYSSSLKAAYIQVPGVVSESSQPLSELPQSRLRLSQNCLRVVSDSLRVSRSIDNWPGRGR